MEPHTLVGPLGDPSQAYASDDPSSVGQSSACFKSHGLSANANFSLALKTIQTDLLLYSPLPAEGEWKYILGIPKLNKLGKSRKMYENQLIDEK